MSNVTFTPIPNAYVPDASSLDGARKVLLVRVLEQC